MNYFVLFISLFSLTNTFAQFGSFSSQFCIGSSEEEFPIKEALLNNGNRIVLLLSNSDALFDKTENSRGGFDFWVLCLDPNDQIVWQKTIGGIYTDYPKNLLITEDQSIYICGNTSSLQSFEQTNSLFGNEDAWLIKMNSTGNILWNKNYGGTDYDDFNELIELPSGNILTFGISNSGISGNKTSSNYGESDIWSLKLDSNGSIINDVSIGGTDFEQRPFVIQTAPNQIKLAAFSYSDISGLKTEPSFGYSDIWVLDLDTTFNIIQQRTIGGSEDDQPTDLLLSNEGNLLILAQSWSNQSGLKTENSFGEIDSWILKLDNDFNIIQQKTIGSDLQEYDGHFIQYPNGNLCIAVNSNSNPNQFKSAPNLGEFDIWIYALDANFNFLTDKTIGTSQDEVLTSLRSSLNLSDIQILAASSGGISNDKACPSKGLYDLWGCTFSTTLQTNDIKASTSMKVYPNPTQDFITIEKNTNDEILALTLLDYSGKIIKRFDSNYTTLQLTDLSKGIYLLQISSTKGNFCEKILFE
jgi:hypothetical protein